MKFNSTTQEKAHKAAIKHKFKAIAFDIDGTITPFARFTIPDSLMKTINSIPTDVPLLLCTGRPFEYIKKKLNNILKHAKDPEAARRQWSIIANNGSSAYVFDPQKNDYEQILSIPWPKERIEKETLEAFIKDRLGWHVVLDTRKYTMVVIFHKHFYLFPRLVRRLSVRLAGQLKKLFTEMDLHGELQIQNSGLGSLIIPVESGKGHAIKAWSKHAGISMKDILCIGDSPGPGENDEDFLSGDFGVSFSVGKQTKNTYPLPVLDEKGRKVWGPSGTEHLLKTISLANL